MCQNISISWNTFYDSILTHLLNPSDIRENVGLCKRRTELSAQT